MQVEELATQALSYASDVMRSSDSLSTTESRLKVLYQITKLLEVCRTRESIVHQFHVSTPDLSSSGGVS